MPPAEPRLGLNLRKPGDVPLGRDCSGTAGLTECISDDDDNDDDDTSNESHPNSFRTCCGTNPKPGV